MWHIYRHEEESPGVNVRHYREKQSVSVSVPWRGTLCIHTGKQRRLKKSDSRIYPQLISQKVAAFLINKVQKKVACLESELFLA